MELVQVDQVVKRAGMDNIQTLVQRETGQLFIRSEFENYTGGRERVNRNGKLSKRIKRNLRRELNITLTDKVVEEIGNIMAANSLSAREYLVEFTSDLQDTCGNYGDTGSCFRGSRTLERMDESGYFSAVRVCKPESRRKLARAWSFNADDGARVLFNAYGLYLDKIAMLAGKLLELEPRIVEFVGGDMLYANNSKCYALGGDRDHYSVGEIPRNLD